MTLDQFELLSEPEQDEEILDHGVYLMNYVRGDIMYDVYKLSGFYVRYCYDLINDIELSTIAYTEDTESSLYTDGVFLI